MKNLEALIKRFTAIYPAEENVRSRRFVAAGFQCEYCKSAKLLEHHHILEGKRRRKPLERFFTTRIICEECHKMKKDAVLKFRSEVNQELLKDFNEDEVRILTGKTKI